MINVSQAFHRTSANPIDESLALTKAQMLTVNDNLMPSKYLTVCQDDGKIYLYDKTNESDAETGRFRVFEGGSTVTVDPTPTQGSTNAVSSGGTYTALDDKVDKVSGKQLSTEDYTTAEKTKLSGVETGAEVNTIEGITVNGDAITPDANKIAALTVLTNTVNNLLNYYTKTETYTKSEVDALVSAVAGATFVSVQTLPTTDIQTNTIYLVPKQTPETSNIKDEYINLDGTTAGWELIGDTGIDLSDYVTTTELNTALADYTTTADLTTLLSGKVDKVNGKQLSTEDYTSAEKTKLAGLSNYDDTALSGRVSDIEDVVPSTATTSNKLATMADVVSGAGGHIIEDSTGVDMTTRTNLQFVGASVTDDSTNDRTVVTVNTSDKADKVASATNGNLASLDNNGNLADSGVASSDVVTTSSTAGFLKNDGTVDTTSYVSDISGKADKVTSATSGDLAGLDANGNITDSGVASNIFPSTATSSNKLATMADVGSGSGHIIEDSTGTDMTARTNLQFVGATVTDDSTNDRTVVTVDGGITSDNISEMNVEFNSDYSVKRVYIIVEDGFEVQPFATASWANIAEALNRHYAGVIDISDYWNIGDEKTITIGAISVTDVEPAITSQDITLVLKQYEGYDLTTPTGNATKCAFIIGAKSKLTENNLKMNGTGTNYGGWENCAMRSWLNGSFYNALPSEFKNIIKSVKVPSIREYNATDMVTSDDKVFLLGAKEFSATATGIGIANATENEALSVLDYYTNHAYSGYSIWTRSVYKSSSSHFVIFSGDRFVEYIATALYSILPHFAI